jgi:chromosome segregation ATPase
MQKALNPELFGTGVAGQARYKDNEAADTHRAAHQAEQKIAEVRGQMKGLTEQMAYLASQVNDYIRSSQVKLEKMTAGMKGLETSQETFRQETSQRLSMAHQRLNERKSMDLKMQELMDRHNSILRSYEVRLNHMQQLIAEKDAQILESQATLNEAKMEIARLKRL